MNAALKETYRNHFVQIRTTATYMQDDGMAKRAQDMINEIDGAPKGNRMEDMINEMFAANAKKYGKDENYFGDAFNGIFGQK